MLTSICVGEVTDTSSYELESPRAGLARKSQEPLDDDTACWGSMAAGKRQVILSPSFIMTDSTAGARISTVEELLSEVDTQQFRITTISFPPNSQ